MTKLLRYEPHSHCGRGSNLRLLDSINRPEDLINRAIELGLGGIAITDHECLSSIPKAFQHFDKIHKSNPNFKVVAGDEIYLCGSREPGQKYYHFILNAKNAKGWRALKELSSRAWVRSYYDRGMERVPVLYNELEAIVRKYPGSLIATTACLGGELSVSVLDLINAEKTGDNMLASRSHDNIVNFMLWNKGLFGEDFYIEIAPGRSKEQLMVNARLKLIAEAFNTKIVIGTDAHYLKKEDRYIHSSYLNSKGGEREVDAFYEYAYLQSDEEIRANLAGLDFDVDELYENSLEIYDKIEMYSIWHNQTIPSIDVYEYPISVSEMGDYMESHYPILCEMTRSKDKYNRYWVNECLLKLNETDRYNDTYLERLEEEARTKKIISEKLGTNIFKYPIVLQHYIDMFWECGSMVGAGRGSSCSGLNHELLGVTQLDPIKWNLPWFRYLNEDRIELPDIDIDLCPSKRPQILQEIKKERGNMMNADMDELEKDNFGCVLVATFGTETSKSAIQTACRGYRSEEYQYGIDNDTAAYLSSLVPQERGFIWPLHDVYYGNPDKERKPVTAFVNEVDQYPGLLEIMFGIEGMVKQRGSHASGVIMNDEDPYEFLAYMKTPSGDIITQFDLHECEAMGATKYDFLVTEVQDKLTKCIALLQEDGQIEKDLSLRQVYDKYFHPNILPIDNKETWEAIQQNKVLNVFQFDSQVGSQAAKKIKPTNILELSDANGLMRLMTSEKGEETPMDKYVRFKNNINLWYQEMEREGLIEEEIKVLEPYFLKSYGVPPSQEQMMLMLMDKDICNFSLKEANAARKIVGKKQMAKIPELKEKVLTSAKSLELGKYVWKYGIGPQMGYSFSTIHALAYSFIGFQTAYIATRWNPIYWNTSCLIVNSGSLEEDSDKGTDYAKVAKALGDIISNGINISLIDINKSDFDFKPDVENNQILFGLKALSGLNGAEIASIKEQRPFTGIKDFMKRCSLGKVAMLSLIKAGAFDNLDLEWAGNRKVIMGYYISIISEPKSKLTLQNFPKLIEKGLVPESLDFERRVFLFNKYLKSHKFKVYYELDTMSYNFYEQYFDLDDVEVLMGRCFVKQATWDKIYKNCMDTARNWLTENQETVKNELNQLLFKETWDKYAAGSISAWEMDSLCFYHGEHELIGVDKERYGIIDFNKLPTEPEVDYFFKRNGKQIPIYKLFRIIGTVIAKNDARSSVTLLTTEGVVNVKFTREYYAMFAKQISEKQEDGTKKVMEKGWFTRGNMIMVTGYRREDIFIGKTYKNTTGHQLYKIEGVSEEGEILLRHDRYGAKAI